MPAPLRGATPLTCDVAVVLAGQARSRCARSRRERDLGRWVSCSRMRRITPDAYDHEAPGRDAQRDIRRCCVRVLVASVAQPWPPCPLRAAFFEMGTQPRRIATDAAGASFFAASDVASVTAAVATDTTAASRHPSRRMTQSTRRSLPCPMRLRCDGWRSRRAVLRRILCGVGRRPS